jgi:hypothetical protein
MDVAWQDGVGSFLDSSGTDPNTFAAFASDGSALWSSSDDSPVFSAQSVLWESGPDSPVDSHIAGLTSDSATGTDAGTLWLGGWIADATPGLAGGTLQGGLLWAGAGNDTVSTLSNNGGVGLGALDLGVAGGTSSQWQQFVDGLGSQVATWAADLPHLLWAGAVSQPLVTAPVTDGLQPLNLAAGASLPLPTAATLSPAQLMWTPPSSATGLTTGPSLADAAPPAVLSGAGVGVFVPPPNGPVITGAGSHS